MASFDPATTLVVMALPEESNGLFEAAGIIPLYTGVGQVKASFALTKALLNPKGTQKTLRVLNLGTAGSFDHPQGSSFECSAFIQRAVNSIGLRSKKIFAGPTLSPLPTAICGTADFIQPGHYTDVDTNFQIMDMEAYALAYVCQQFQISFHSIKYVTDHSDEFILQDWKKNLQVSAETLLKTVQGLI